MERHLAVADDQREYDRSGCVCETGEKASDLFESEISDLRFAWKNTPAVIEWFWRDVVNDLPFVFLRLAWMNGDVMVLNFVGMQTITMRDIEWLGGIRLDGTHTKA